MRIPHLGIPEHWPLFAPGLVMAYLRQSVLVVYQDEHLTSESFELHLRELAAAIDTRWATRNVGVLYDVRAGHHLFDAKRRKQIAEVLDARREKLREQTSGYALVTPSAMVRGVLRAVFWVAPPPYPYEIAPTTRHAFDFLAACLPGESADALEREYRALLARASAGVDATASRR